MLRWFKRGDISRLAFARLAVGLGQGITLYLLLKAAQAMTWPATSKYLFPPAVMIALFVPLIVIVCLGHMRTRRLLAWAGAVTAILAGLAVYDVWRRGDAPTPGLFALTEVARSGVVMPSIGLVFWAFLIVFVAQSLMAAGESDRRLIGRYTTYFDVSWKYAVQGILAWGFTCTFWLLLVLGAALFWLIHIEAPRRLLEHQWFNIPVTTATLAYAIHVVDTRAALVRSVRVLKLTLLGWLLPIFAVIAAAFLLSLPFTGLEPLWSTRRATPMLLATAAALILLINAAYQDGDETRAVPITLRLAGRLAAVLIVPLIAISTYSIGTRIAQYGWTTSRVVVSAGLLVSWIYALGYAWAAIDRRTWLKPLEITNVIASFATVAVVLALLSPLVDPARLAVASQVARLAAGRIEPARFDVAWLRWDAGRYGQDALKTLADSANAPTAVREKATAILALTNRYEAPKLNVPTTDELVANITVYPTGRELPKGFTDRKWTASEGPGCLTNRTIACEAYFIDIDGDGIDEIFLMTLPRTQSDFTGNTATVYSANSNGTWTRFGAVYTPCADVRAKLRVGEYQAVTSAINDLRVGDVTLRVQTQPTCSPKRG